MPEWPRLRITCEAFLALPEYSATNPTGTTPGKRWRRLDGAFDAKFLRSGGKPRWLICQYDPDSPEDAKTIKILVFKPIVIIKPEVSYHA